MSRRKRPNDDPKKKKPEEHGTILPGRASDVPKPAPGDEAPMSSLPFAPAGGEQFGTLHASGSDPAAGEQFGTLHAADSDPNAGKGLESAGRSTQTVAAGSSIVEPTLKTVATAHDLDPEVANTLKTQVLGGSDAKFKTQVISPDAKNLPTDVDGNPIEPVDLNQALNIRTHFVDGELSGIVRLEDPENPPQDFTETPSGRPEYEVLSELARGGMGVVYTAQQTSLSRRLAIKTLMPGSGTTLEGETQKAASVQEDRKLRDMFVSEAVVTANLVHPNIVPVHDLGQTVDGKLFYSMKKVEGVPWHHRIAEMSVEENLDVLMKVADAVAFAHYNGVVNRDLKPENVAIGSFGEVAVLDWGLAVTTQAFKQRECVVTHSEGFGGSPGYMAPEQVRGIIHEIGYHTDIYLLGAILFQVISGRAPHQFAAFDNLTYTEAISETLQAALNNQIEQTDQKGELLDIAMKAMSTRPEDRYEHVEAFQDAIREYRLTGRADELLRNAPAREQEQGYADYQAAVALYDEAATKFPGNERAGEGLREASLKYANLALKRGDYDLGLQVVGQRQEPEFTTTRRKLKSARTRRGFFKWTWGIASIAAIVGLVVAIAARAETQAALTKLTQKNGELDEAEATLTAKRAELDEKTRDLAAKSNELIAKSGELETKSAELTTKTAALTSKTEELGRKTAELEAKETELEAKTTELTNKTTELTTKTNELATKTRDLRKAESDRIAANRAKAEAETQTKFAEFSAWQTKLQTALANGDTSRALILLTDEIPQDNEDVRQNQDVFDQLKQRLQHAATSLNTAVSAVDSSPDGSLLVVGGPDGDKGKVTVWSVDEQGTQRKPLSTLGLPATPDNVAVAPDGRQVAFASGKQLSVRSRGDRELLKLATATRVSALAYSRDGQKLLLGTEGGAVRVFDVSAAAPVEITEATRQYKDRVNDVYWLQDSASKAGHLLVIIAGTRQRMCGAVPFRYVGDKLELPARVADGGGKQHWIALDLPEPGESGTLRLDKMHFSGDEKMLAITSQDSGELLIFRRRTSGKLSLFPFETGLEATNFRHALHTQGNITHVAFSPGKRRLVTAADDSRIRVWNLDGEALRPAISNGRENNLLMGHADAIASCAFIGTSENLLATTSLDKSLHVWDLSTYTRDRQQILRSREKVSGIGRLKTASGDAEASPNVSSHTVRGAIFFFAYYDPQQLAVPTRRDQKRTLRIGGHVGEVSSAAFGPDDKRIVTAGQDQTARVWESATGEPSSAIRTMEEGHNYNLSSLRFFPDGRHLLTTSFDGTLLIWDTVNDSDGLGRELTRIDELGMANAVAISESGDWVVTSAAKDSAAEGKKIFGAQLWKKSDLLDNPERPPFFGTHGARVSALAIAPNDDRIVTADRLGKVSIWHADGSKLLENYPAHEDGISSAEFVSQTSFITAGFDGKVKMWKIEGDRITQDSSRPFSLEQDYIWRLRLSPKKNRLLTSAFRQVDEGGKKQLVLTIQAWNVETGESASDAVYARKYPVSDVARAYRHDIAWAPNGDEAIIVADGKLRFYDTGNWQQTKRLVANGGVTPSAAVYSPTDIGDPLIATGDHRTVHLWRVTSDDAGQPRGLHEGTFRSSARVASAGFSSDGEFIITGSRSIRVFAADAEGKRAGSSVLRIERVDGKLVHGGVLTWVEFTPEAGSHRFATSGIDGTAQIWDWDPSAGESPRSRKLKCGGPVRQVRWSPDGKYLVTIDDEGGVCVWNTGADEPPIRLPNPGDGHYRYQCCAFSPDSELENLKGTKWIVAGGVDMREQTSVAVIWKLTENVQKPWSVVRARIHGNRGVTAAAFTPDGRLITGGPRGSLVKWEWLRSRDSNHPDGVPSARMLFPITHTNAGRGERNSAHRGTVTSIDVGRDGTFVSSGRDGVVIWQR